MNITHTCLYLGGTVHMVCRSKERGEAAQSEIKEQAQNEVCELGPRYMGIFSIIYF